MSAENSTNASDTGYVKVSSPYTFHVSKECSPQGEHKQPRSHSAGWKRPPANKGSVGSELRGCQDSDSERLALERQYQLELQQRIRANNELVGLSAEEMEKDSLEEDDSLESSSSEEPEEAEYDLVHCTFRIPKKESSGRKQQPVDKYSSLKYDPNWKNTKEAAKFFKVGKKRRVAEGDGTDLSQDSFYLHSSISSEEKNQQGEKFLESFSEFDTDLLSFHEPNAFVRGEPFRLHTKGNEPSDGCYHKDSPSKYSRPLSLQIPKDQPQKAKKDFVEKNKQTLGLRKDKNKSYLQLHGEKQEVTQEQVADTKTVDEEPAQSALPDPNTEMSIEEKWHLNSQRLKEQKKKLSQKNKAKSNQNLEGRALARRDNNQPAGKPAKPKSLHQKHHQMSELQTAPMQAMEQNSSSALQKKLCPNPSNTNTNTAANSGTCLNNFPVCTSKKNKNCQRDHPNGLPHGQQHLYNHATVPSFPGDGSTRGQAHPNQKQRQSSSVSHVNCQEKVKNQVLLQDNKRHTYATSSLWPSQASVKSSSAAFNTVSQHQDVDCVREADGLHSFSPLPPLIPHVESEVDQGRGDGNQVKIIRIGSEGNLMQMDKQKQHKVCTKPYSSKAYINLDMKLGGLGPDYEGIKEKKEKLKRQREYAQRIKENNMKNAVLVQKLPTKPQVTSLSSRQKALEYAKKIPTPKTFTARQSDKEVKEKRGLLPTLRRDILPPIPSLENLKSRHEKEKQVVAAFKTLRIL